MGDFKYFVAYLLPLSVWWSLHAQGVWAFSGFVLGFVLLPGLELLTKGDPRNYSPKDESRRLGKRFFDILLYLNVPILYGLLSLYLNALQTGGLAAYEIAGMTISMGIACGTVGINVAHELGHRQHWAERLMAKMLLLPSHYMHFIIEHNLGHHKNVSTDLDPASARLNESIYAFYLRSVVGSYVDAWRIESKLLAKRGLTALHPSNAMLHFVLVQGCYLAAVFWFFGPQPLMGALAVGIIGFLLLETVNYIEHYGLRRRLLPSGRYEPVQPWHSWNSDHELGRIFLYELTRHSDHHYKATRKYQVLRHFDESPQLPVGYPAAMLLAMVPPLWFRTMNPLAQNTVRNKNI
jgi:alkane 1-monooxygenase